MATAASALVTTEGDTRYLRWLLLLDKGGTLVLRQVFDIKAPPATLAAHLNSQRARLHGLKSRKVINDDQWDLLYPPSGRPPDSTTFDITLLTCLLRNICGLNQASPAWTGAILPTDVSVEADIYRLRMIRNQASHLSPKSLTDQEYNTNETEIEQVLLRLGSSIPDLQKDINTLKASPIDKDCESGLLETVQEWQDLGTTLIEDNKEIKDDITNVNKTVDSINRKVSEDLPKSICVVKQDVSTVKVVVSDIKAEVEDIPSKISAVNEDLRGLNKTIEDLPGSVKSAVDEGVSGLKKDIENLGMKVSQEDDGDFRRKIEGNAL